MTFLSHHIIIIAALRSPVPAIQTATDVAHQHVSVTMCTMLFLPGMGAVEQALLLCWKRCVYSQQVDKGCSPNALLGHWTCAAQHPGAVIFAVWCFGGLLVFEWGRACFFFQAACPKQVHWNWNVVAASVISRKLFFYETCRCFRLLVQGFAVWHFSPNISSAFLIVSVWFLH